MRALVRGARRALRNPWGAIPFAWGLSVLGPDLWIRGNRVGVGYAAGAAASLLAWFGVVMVLQLSHRLGRAVAAVAAGATGFAATVLVGAPLGYFRFYQKDIQSLEWEFLLENPAWAASLVGDAMDATQAVAVAAAPLLVGAVLYWTSRHAPAPRARTAALLGVAVLAASAVACRYVRTVPPDLHGARVVVVGTRAHLVGGRVPRTLPAPRRLALPARRPERRPDVIVFLGESMGYREAFGTPAQMPQTLAFIARRPERAMAFTRAKATATATTVALPTLLTGLDPRSSRDDFARAPLLWHLARAAGYHTALFSAQSFDVDLFRYFFLEGDGPDVVRVAGDWRPVKRVNELGVDDRLATDAAISWLRGATDERPLFLVLHFNAPHWPCWAPHLTRGRWRETTVAPMRHDPARCEAATRFVDGEIGRVLAELDRSARLDDTLIVGTSDHGEVLRPGRPLRHYSFYEEVLAVPLWVHLPRQLASAARVVRDNASAVVSNLDVYATLVDLWDAGPSLAGARPFAGGVSLLRPVPSARTVVATTDSPISREWQGFALYCDQWKWVVAPGLPGALFDLERDPDELRDRVDEAPPFMLELLRSEAARSPALAAALRDLAPARVDGLLAATAPPAAARTR